MFELVVGAAAVIYIWKHFREESQENIMGWSRYNRHSYGKDYRDSDGNDIRGGNDEYTTQYCHSCNEMTEHDVCTGECVDCS